jgi:arylsulfatase A-like enzyme
VSLIDVAPTILASLSVAVPATMQGIALGDGPPAPRRIFAETFQNPVAHSPDCPDGCVTKVLVEWPLKFVENQTKGRLELFDLARDPHEEHNLFAARREMADPLAAHLTEWSKSMPAQSTEVKRVNPSIANTLRGNGYIAK